MKTFQFGVQSTKINYFRKCSETKFACKLDSQAVLFQSICGGTRTKCSNELLVVLSPQVLKRFILINAIVAEREQNKGQGQKVEPQGEKKWPQSLAASAECQPWAVLWFCLRAPHAMLSLSVCLSLSLPLSVRCFLSDSGLLVHSSDKAVRVAGRENGWSKAPLSSIWAPPAS